jgi:hypothetical protein
VRSTIWRFALPLMAALVVMPTVAQAGKLHVRKAEQWPTLAPAAAFDGTPCSGYGGTCPNSDAPKFTCAPGAVSNYGGGCQTVPGTPIARTQAQPAILWTTAPHQRLVTDKLICVDADAKGGVAYVRFYGEGGVADVRTPGFVHYTDVNGKLRTKWGYCVRLDAAAWRAETTTGSGYIFAEAFPVRSDMTSRIIGHAHTYTDAGGRTYDTVQYAGNFRMVVYPRTAEHDWPGDADGVKTVCASGCDYATIKLAIDAAVTASAEAPKIVLNATENYELESRGSTYTSGKGYLTIAAATGVTATLRRATAYSGSETNAGSAWTWTPGWDGVEFRGEGVVIDRRNFQTVTFSSRSPWVNGAKITNSIGTRDTAYWSGSTPPDFSWSHVPFVQDATIEYVVGATNGALATINTTVRDTAGMIFNSAHYVYGLYLRGYSNRWFYRSPAALKIAYNGAGTATLTETGTESAAGSLALKVNGSTVTTIALGKISTDTNPTIQHVVDAINTYGNGWSASVQNSRGALRASLLSADDQGGAATDTAVASGAGTSFYAAFDVHAEWAMWFNSPQADSSLTPLQNLIYRNNISRDLTGESGPVVNPACGFCYDIIVKNNVWVADPIVLNADYDNARVGAWNFSGPVQSHTVWAHNIMQAGINRIQNGSFTDLTFSQFEANVVGAGFRTGGSDFSADQAWNGTFFFECCGIGNMATTGGSNNTKYLTHNPGDSGVIAEQAFVDLFRDVANGDFRPAASGTVETNLKSANDNYDARGCRRSASDYAGAWSKNCVGRPSYPF